MTSFKNLDLKTTYSSLEYDLLKDLVSPLLEKAQKYQRVVGFFSSTWLREVATSLAQFAANGGKAEILTSVILSQSDWEAIAEGGNMSIEKKIVEQVETTIRNLEQELQTNTLVALAWMVKEGILHFRFGIPTEDLSGGMLHTKLSVFYDAEQNGVVVFGSQNDSYQATLNEETLNLFTSWSVGEAYFSEHARQFEERWSGRKERLRVVEIPDAAKHIIIRAAENAPCPFKRPSKRQSVEAPQWFNIREYQEEAIAAWRKAGCRGLFEMATGTGKTFTSIAAATSLFQDRGRLLLVVLVPYKHLVEQWEEDLQAFGFEPIKCFESKSTWFDEANSKLRRYRANLTNHLCFIATHTTASLDAFQTLAKRFPSEWLLIADEVHELGAPKLQKALIHDAAYRIGLSATPDRWYDKQGTQIITDYFETKVVEYPLSKAISEDKLVEYDYEPILIDLTPDELEDYAHLTKQIGMLLSSESTDRAKLEQLCRRRARLISAAALKLPRLLTLIRQHRREAEENEEKYSHALVYCCPGENRAVLRALADEGLRAHEFVHDVPMAKRQEILVSFDKMELDAVVAIKCLDQGVDVPATRRAYILASTTNPREFVQRRGRVLRKAHGKERAFIYDFVVGPWDRYRKIDKSIGQSLLKRELPRFAEFNELAINKNRNMEVIFNYCKHFDLVEEMRLKPWEVYARIRDTQPDLLTEESTT